jgi:hypothetical protein
LLCDTVEIKEFNNSVLEKDQLKVNIPTLSPNKKTFTESHTVTLSCKTEGAAIYYRLHHPGIGFTTSEFIRYEGPITLSQTTEIHFYAKKEGMRDSRYYSEMFTKIESDLIAEKENSFITLNANTRNYSDIKLTFPDAKGYSERNLRYMRRFADMFSDFKNLQVPLADLTWYHLQSLMDKVSDKSNHLHKKRTVQFISQRFPLAFLYSVYYVLSYHYVTQGIDSGGCVIS